MTRLGRAIGLAAAPLFAPAMAMAAASDPWLSPVRILFNDITGVGFAIIAGLGVALVFVGLIFQIFSLMSFVKVAVGVAGLAAVASVVQRLVSGA